MILYLSMIISVVAILLSVLALIYCIESASAILANWKKPRTFDRRTKRNQVAVIVPAHNEAASIGETVAMIKSQLDPDDRLIVVADNCSDGTALCARNAGATVIERTDETKRGKSYALDYAIRYLEREPPSTVVFIDADCKIGTDTLDVLARTCERVNRPVQAKYVMAPPSNSRLDFCVASFAFLVKNHVRLLGLKQFGLPCQLTGSGMAFPWKIIASADLASGHLTEDMKLGLDLAAAGHHPYFCPEAIVTSEFPHTAKGAGTQSERWYRGHLSMVSAAPKFILKAIQKRDVGLFFLTLDMAVPPLFMLIVLLTLTGLAAAFVAVLGGHLLPVLISFTILKLVIAATLATWWVFGRKALPAELLPRIFPFVAAKLRLYPKALIRDAEPQWVRTDRAGSDSESEPPSRR